MITEPKNLTEQILNLVERIATEMKALYATLETKLSATEAADTYATKITTYTKEEVDALVGAGASGGGLDRLALLDQLSAFYAGYTGEIYSYRDCLDASDSDVLAALYSLYNGYMGTSLAVSGEMTEREMLSKLYEFANGYEGAL